MFKRSFPHHHGLREKGFANSLNSPTGLILLPIVGNAAEHATAVTVAIKDKMDLAIGVAVGSSLQIALLVLPLMIMLNWWGVGAPADLTLDFDGFLVSVLFIAIILVNYVVQDGKSNWLEGFMLQGWFSSPPNLAIPHIVLVVSNPHSY